MITDNDFDLMLKAREIGKQSTCQRRKIGVYIPIKLVGDNQMSALASNNPAHKIHCCSRAAGVCPAIHAEVAAVMNLSNMRYDADSLYIWAETPCHACLSFIRRYSHIIDIYCLTAQSYSNEYPRVLDRTLEIKFRSDYAEQLGFRIHMLDAQEVNEYESKNREQV